MRRIAVISGLLSMTMINSAQAVSYSYDASGNRTELTRTISWYWVLAHPSLRYSWWLLF